MKQHLAVFALAAALVEPASAITFPSLTTIYIVSGVMNSAHGPSIGEATSFHCTNVSGVTATIRYVVLHQTGATAGSITRTMAHGVTITASTHETEMFADSGNEIAPVTSVFQGGINIESTQSGVFCTARLVDAEAVKPDGIDIHLVRVNPHPGTVE